MSLNQEVKHSFAISKALPDSLPARLVCDLACFLPTFKLWVRWISTRVAMPFPVRDFRVDTPETTRRWRLGKPLQTLFSHRPKSERIPAQCLYHIAQLQSRHRDGAGLHPVHANRNISVSLLCGAGLPVGQQQSGAS